MKLKPYPKYKDSGIKWIGEIPEEWEVRRLKFLLSSLESGGRETGGGNQLSKGVFSLGGEHINWDGRLNLKNTKLISEEYYNSMNQGKLKINDVLLVKDGATIGKTAILIKKEFKKMAVNEHVFLMRSKKKINSKLLYYLICSDSGFKQIKLTEVGSAQGGINQDFIAKVYFSIPDDKQIQTSIANFLDRKTAKINTLIEKDKILIKLLKEKRIALINHAVTKGLPVRDTQTGLNPQVKLKYSGVDWIGKIPDGWSFAKLKHLTKLIIDGTHFTPKYLAEGIPFLRVTDIQSDKINFDDIKFISKEEHKELNYRCNPKKGDLLLSKNGTIGIPKVIDWDYSFSIFVSLCLIKVNNKLYVNYLKYSILTRCIKEQILYRSKTTSVTNLHLDQIKEFIIAFPQRPEQLQIVKYLDKATSRIDKTIQKIKKKINLLEEYKKSLIHHTVTGKIDVREFEA